MPAFDIDTHDHIMPILLAQWRWLSASAQQMCLRNGNILPGECHYVGPLNSVRALKIATLSVLILLTLHQDRRSSYQKILLR